MRVISGPGTQSPGMSIPVVPPYAGTSMCGMIGGAGASKLVGLGVAGTA